MSHDSNTKGNINDHPQATTFDGLPEDCNIDEWRNTLENFGHVQMIYFSTSKRSGYAIFEKHHSAALAAEALHETNYPPNTSNPITLQLIGNDEVEDFIHLKNSKLNNVSLLKPETGGNLFKVTKTQPPIYWSMCKH